MHDCQKHHNGKLIDGTLGRERVVVSAVYSQ